MGKLKFYVTTVVTLLSLSFHADTISASSNAVLSQENKSIILEFNHYNDDNQSPTEDSDMGNRRDISIISILPYAIIESNKIIMHGNASFHDACFCIRNNTEVIFTSEPFNIVNAETTEMTLPSLNNGTYYVILEIGEEKFIAEFTI